MQESVSAPLLNLDSNRWIALTAASKTRLIFCCRRISDADWIRYFNSILISSSNEGKARVNTLDLDTPYLALVDAVLETVSGYKVAGDIAFEKLPDWKQRIPANHRRAVGKALSDVRASKPGEDFVIYPEGEKVFLDATWGSVQTGDSVSTIRFERLSHLLATPTEKQHKRYAAEASRSRVIGGSRSGQTIYSGAQQVLAALYDELVLSVDEAYRVDGKPLETREQIVREMDMLHKVVAAQQVFAPADDLAAGSESEGE